MALTSEYTRLIIYYTYFGVIYSVEGPSMSHNPIEKPEVSHRKTNHMDSPRTKPICW